jgi:hypothetical protein
MMLLTKSQIKYVNSRQKQLLELIASKPQQSLFRFYMELDAIQLIIDLHNIAMKEEKDASTTNSTVG